MGKGGVKIIMTNYGLVLSYMYNQLFQLVSCGGGVCGGGEVSHNTCISTHRSTYNLYLVYSDNFISTVSLPFSRSISTMSAWPFQAALWSGVSPSLFLAFTSTLCMVRRSLAQSGEGGRKRGRG